MEPVSENELVQRNIGNRVSLYSIEQAIQSEHYFTAAEGVLGNRYVNNEDLFGIPNDLETLTFCALIMKNGFTVVGQSACADPANYKEDLDQRIAREDAVSKIWPLMGYELKSKLAEAERPAAGSAPAEHGAGESVEAS